MHFPVVAERIILGILGDDSNRHDIVGDKSIGIGTNRLDRWRLVAGIGSIINLKYVPSVIRDAPPEVLQLTYAKLTGNRSGQMRPGRATLEFSGSRLNPLDQIPVLEIKSAGFTENSYTLEYGEVLFDYLDP